MQGADELRTALGRVRRRWFARTILTTSGRAAAASSVPVLVSVLAAWLLQPSGAALVLVAAVVAGLALAAAVVVFSRMQRRPDDCQVARFVEERAAAEGLSPALGDALASAVQVAECPDKHAGAFSSVIVRNANDALRGIGPSLVIPTEALRRAGLEAAAGALLLAVAGVAGAPYLARAAAATWVALFPGSIEIRVITGDVRVPAGQPLRVAAAIDGPAAALAGLVPALVVSADGQERSVAMRESDGGFIYAFESVDRSFRYRVKAGSASSDAYAVTAMFPARVTRIDIRYEYPSFTGQPPREEEDGGDIHAPAGTRVRLQVHTDKPVKTGELALAAGRPIPLRPGGNAVASAEFVLTRDDAYRVKLTDADGLQARGEIEYFIRVMDDRPPDVRIVRPAADQGVTPLEEVAIEARADDDYGIAEFELVYAVAGRPARTIPFANTSGPDVAKVGTYLLAAEDLAVQPGDLITYYARARDVPRGKRSTQAQSDIFFLEVKPFNEEFVAAQSQVMGGGAGWTQIDSLIAAQKEIISATWNLERRSGAGRSEADIKSVGEAQAELKARVEQMLRGARRGGGGLYPPQQVATPRPRQPRGGPDPVSAAIDAMARAAEQLERARTAEAIPHEMAALQGLLQAQAEVRRRQVMQQAAGAGQGGTSRTDRDLSALFDRELRRQQRTSYETPRSSRDAEREDSSDALERIRELARRQEELARRQREAAGNRLTDAERRRQLEQLTREQQELRQQLDELEKRLQSAAAGAAEPSRTKGGAAGTSAAGDMRKAADQMRRAASEMQRQNPGAAAANAEQAAEALRQGERRMRDGSPDARHRAAGEVQLEAQQIAEAQRRIASEVSRLDKEGDETGTDALRRLAAEKDKLADRVEALQRSARDVGAGMPGSAGAPLRDAAQQLERQRIAERMRDAAGSLKGRSAAGAPAGAPARDRGDVERQLSRALDSIVDTLGGSAEARRLTTELDRAREMRERLNRLEQQVREAEQGARAGRQGSRAGQGGRQAGGESPGDQLQRLREEYARELERAGEALSRSGSSQEQRGLAGSTPEHHEFSRSAPGTEAFKQDFSGWDRLRTDIDVRLERYESALAARLARQIASDRLTAGGSDRVPDGYRRSVSRYFESLAKVKP